jgi:superfamily II DNA/RNA helicase/cold shock CspA family protein
MVRSSWFPSRPFTRTERHTIPSSPSFLDLGLSAAISSRLVSQGIGSPLPIQSATIPEALAGHDICGQAPTGSGKTLAFGVVLATRSAGASPRRPRALVLVPTRELAEQVRTVVASLLDDPSRVTALYGGTGYTAQRHALRRGVDIVVACPGRLEDLIGTGDISLDDVRTVVLDEADRMVDMGFLRPVCRLVDQTAAGRQLLLFSATIGTEVDAISRRFQSQPFRYRVEHEPDMAGNVTHLFWRTPHSERIGITAQLVEHHGQAFVFCRTKRSADRVARQLRAAGVEAAPIHGDRSQPQRDQALAAFASRRTRALVGTDVIARGIHVDDVACVVHFDLATDRETYVHRSGRTGRAGRAGTVVSLVPDELHDDVRALQRALGFPRHIGLPFEATAAAPVPRGERLRGTPAAPVPAAPVPAAPVPAAPVPAAPVPRGERLRGTVKFFDQRRGYGFLSGPGGIEVFVHHSTVGADGGGRALLVAGEEVSFELAHGGRGEEARQVVPTRRSPQVRHPAPGAVPDRRAQAQRSGARRTRRA